jgi:hypothetical protein
MARSEQKDDLWPSIPFDEWKDTYDTLHMWLEILGKIRLELAPMINHWWQVTLSVTSRGLSTLAMPYHDEVFQIDLDFIDHVMRISKESGDSRTIELKPRTVADFYAETMDALRSLGMDVSIWTTPVEVPERIPFEQDTKHASYDKEYTNRFWRVLVQAERIMEEFRSGFIGKDSPVQFYWGGVDMAVSRFSGRTAPKHPGFPNVARYVMEEAYSHELSSCGFWPGAGLGEAAFYAYTYPEPAGYREYPIGPPEAYFNTDLGEYILPYEAVRKADSPDGMLMKFFQSTYEAGANLAGWDRKALERTWGPPFTHKEEGSGRSA